MSVRLRELVAAATAAAVLAGLGGCDIGGSGKGDEAAVEPLATPTAAPTAEPTRKADTLTPSAQADAFTGLRKSAFHLIDLADRLALGVEGAAGDADTAAATYRTTFTYLLTEHVYLVGTAARTAVEKSETAPATEQALAALDANSKALAEAFGTFFDGQQREEFRTGWTAFARSFFTYAVAGKDGDAAEQRKAELALDTYRVTAADFFAKTPESRLPAYQTKAELRTHIANLKNALDAVAADDDGNAFDLLRAAALDMVKSAAVIAKGTWREPEGGSGGDLESEAATLRANLAGLATQHTYLMGLAFSTAYMNAKHFASPAYLAAKATLEDNSKDIASVVREVSSSERQVTFLEEWRDQIRDLEDYAEAGAFDNQRAQDVALESLYDYQASAGTFFDKLTKRRDAAKFSDEISRHLESFAGTIDALKSVFSRSRSS